MPPAAPGGPGCVRGQGWGALLASDWARGVQPRSASVDPWPHHNPARQLGRGCLARAVHLWPTLAGHWDSAPDGTQVWLQPSHRGSHSDVSCGQRTVAPRCSRHNPWTRDSAAGRQGCGMCGQPLLRSSSQTQMAGARRALVGRAVPEPGDAVWHDHLRCRWLQQGSAWLPVSPPLGMQGTGLGWEEAALSVSPALPRLSLWVPGRVSSSCTWKRLQSLGLCEAQLLEGPSAPGPGGGGFLCRKAAAQRPLRAGIEGSHQLIPGLRPAGPHDPVGSQAA